MGAVAGSATDARFRRDHRLNLKSDFARVFKRNHRSADRMFVVLARTGTANGPRLGMAISLKATGRAVSRNRIKRLVRESFRQHRTHLPPLDFVVTARPGVAREPSARIAESLQAHWNRIAKQCAEF